MGACAQASFPLAQLAINGCSIICLDSNICAPALIRATDEKNVKETISLDVSPGSPTAIRSISVTHYFTYEGRPLIDL